MKALKFILKGKTAHFKIPEVNMNYYFTYGNIHKPALLGLLGAIAGYRGYQQGYQKEYADYPEYYSKLKDIKISIVPTPKDGYFSKKIQVFNNSVGYASMEQGGNLIVKEQWLENPEWTIYLMLDCEESLSMAELILENRCTYMPYLGKNDHPATIINAQLVDLEETRAEDATVRCIMPENLAEFDFDEMNFKYQEYLPVALDFATNQYVTEKFILTDAEIMDCDTQVYKDGEHLIVFY